MDFFRHFPLFSIITAFVGVVLCTLLSSKRSRICTYIIELICTLLGIGTLIYANKFGDTIYQMGHLSYENSTPLYWFNNVIRFGQTEGLLASIFPPILFLCLLGGYKKMQEDVKEEKQKYYYVLSNLALVALISLIYTDDVFTGYVFLEISTLSSIGLIAIKDKGRTTVAAIRYMIFNLVGSGLFLIGIVILYDLTGYFMLEKIHYVLIRLVESGESLPAITCSFALITVGLGIKSGLFPFYFWMADTYGESTTSSASIISGLISKGYIFLLIKLFLRGYGLSNGESVGVVETTGICTVLFIFGICGMIFGSISAIFEKRINKMIAYSSAAQIGYIYLALGMGLIGIVPAIYQLIAHTISKPLLFVSARGLIDVSDHHPQFHYLKGSGKRNILAGIGFSFGALSMIGFPLTAGFTVKLLFMNAALSLDVDKLVWTIIALTISTLLNTCYFIRTVITIYSPEEDKLPIVSNYHNRLGFIVSIIIFIVLNVLCGTLPSVIEVISNSILL